MSIVLWLLIGASVAVAVFAWRRASHVAQQAARMRHEYLDLVARLKRDVADAKEAAEILRVHVAAVAAGTAVPTALIASGRLYRSLSGIDVQATLADEAAGRGSAEPPVFVDLRSAKEYAIKRIAGAQSLPFEELEARYDAEIPAGSIPVVVYCENGERSRLACDFLSRKGRLNLYHIRDGLRGWAGPTEGEGPLTLIQIDRPSAARR